MSRVRTRSRVRALALAVGLGLGLPLATTVAPTAPADAVDCPLPGPLPPGTFPPCPGMALPPGYIFVSRTTAPPSPFDYQLFGTLGDSNLWTCSPATSTGGAYKVTCTPTASNFLSWRCYYLHADATTVSAGGRVRTSLDCDGSSPPEAQTATVTGPAGHDSVVVPSQVTANVTEFSCTFDDGGTQAPTPDFVAGCGDPGLAELD